LRSDKLHRQIFFTGLHTAVIVPHLFEKGYTFDGPQALQPLLPPGPLGAFSGPASGTQPRSGITGVYSGTLIRVKNFNAILGFVEGVTPNELQSRIVSVQGF